MAQIDKLIEKMEESKVERAILINDQPMRLVSAGRETSGASVVPMLALQSMVQEILPANLQTQLSQDGNFKFPYQAVQGIYNIAIERSNGRLQVSIIPLTPTAPSRPQAVLPANLSVAPQPSDASQVTFISPQNANKGISIGLIIAGIMGLIFLTFGGLWIRSTVLKAEQDHGRQEAQAVNDERKSIYDQYTQQIQNLAQVAVIITHIPRDDKVGDATWSEYLIAKTNDVNYQASVQKLEKQIKDDALLEGSETSGQKADLLKALKDESSRNSPFSRASEINKETGNHVYEVMTAMGKDSLKLPAVLNVVMSYKGMDGLKQLSQGEGEISFQNAASSMFKDASLMPTH